MPQLQRTRIIPLGGGSSIIYALFDKFLTDVAAGSVNGTLAEPTGQARTVTDTNSKLSIVDNTASFATGGVGAGDPGLWYPSMALSTGRTLLATIVITDSASKNSAMFGWDASAAGVISNSVAFATDGLLRVTQNASAAISVGAYTDGVAYKVIVIQRAAGSFMFIQGGAFTNPTLIWHHVVGTTATLPGVTVLTGTAGIFTIDNIRSPSVERYIPNPLAYDTFTRSDGALGSTEAAGPDAQVIAALAWAFTTNIWTISTNKAIATPALGADVIVNGAFAADTDWTKGSGWAIGSGVATATTATADLTQTAAPLTVDRWYQVEYTVSGFAAGTVAAVAGGIVFPTHAADATYTETGKAGTTAFLMRGAAGFSGSIDNVSAKLLVTAELFASVQVSTADVIADVAITLSGAGGGGLQAGLVLNLDSTANPQNFILCYLNGNGSMVLQECVAGTYTTKFTTSITYSAGAVLRVVRDGTSCRCFYNSGAINTVQTMTANTNTKHGLFLTSALNSLDGFLLWPRGTGGEHATLNTY